MRRARVRPIAAALAIVALAALGACGGGSGDGDTAATDSQAPDDAYSVGEEDAPFEVSGSPVDTDKVTLPRSYKFDPAVIRVKPGTSVTWENKDDFPHNVKLVGQNSDTKDLPVGGTASITFDQAGTFYYQCTLHPAQMKGKVIVQA
jgi:plastocyanin